MVISFIYVSLLGVSLSGFVIECAIYKPNTTDLSKCSVAYSRSGSTYKELFPIKSPPNQSSLTLDFHFAVLAASDAHILLASTNNVSKSDPVYEVVIGAGGNTFCDIRRKQKSDVRNSVRIKNLLSALDPSFFWIHISKNGTIGVGKEGENTSFITWEDPEPLPVHFVGFSTWSGIEAKWYFNCDRALELEEPSVESLKNSLLFSYSSSVLHSQDTVVYATFNVEYVDLDEYTTILTTHGHAKMVWQDNFLTWNPDDFLNITELYIEPDKVWKPNITYFSWLTSQNGTSDQAFQDSKVSVESNGVVTWTFAVNTKSLCEDSDLYFWPRDKHFCVVLFELCKYPGDKFYFNISNYQSILIHHKSSQWAIVKASVLTPLADIRKGSFKDSEHGFQFYFNIRRSSMVHNVVFFAPFIAIAICLLLSFWIPPKGYVKVIVVCTQLVLETIMLLSLVYFIPPSSKGTPFLVQIYIWSLFGSVLSVIIAIIIINISSRKQSRPLPHVITRFLTRSAVKKYLLLPSVVMPEDYGDLDISLTLSSVSRTEDKGQRYWILLGIAIDRCAFLIYAIFVLAVMVKYIAAYFDD